MSYICRDLSERDVQHLELTGVLDEFYLACEKYLEGDRNFNYANCGLTTEEFNNLTQDQKKYFWRKFLRPMGRIVETTPFEEPEPYVFKSLAIQSSDGYILHLYNGYIDGNTWVEERGLTRPDASGSRAYTFTNDFWTPKYTYLKSLGITKIKRVIDMGGELVALLTNPDSYNYNSHLDASTMVVEDVTSTYPWGDVTHKHITIDLT